MVSENLFNEILIPNEQKPSSILESGTNFHNKMAKVDVGVAESSLLRSPASTYRSTDEINKHEKLNSSSRGNVGSQKEDYDILTSDIELTIEDSDGKETPSESEDTITNGHTSGNASNDNDRTLVLNKDIDSVESLDIDLTNTANLVGKRFLQDDFDSANSLDSVDEAMSQLPLNDIQNEVNVSDIVPNSNSFSDEVQVVETNKKQQALQSSQNYTADGTDDQSSEALVTSTDELKTDDSSDNKLIEIKLENECESTEKSKSDTVSSETDNVSQSEFNKTEISTVPHESDAEAQKTMQTKNSVEVVSNTEATVAVEKITLEQKSSNESCQSTTAKENVQSQQEIPEIKEEIQNTDDSNEPKEIEPPHERAIVKSPEGRSEIESSLSNEIKSNIQRSHADEVPKNSSSTSQSDEPENEDDYSLQIKVSGEQPVSAKIPKKATEVQPVSCKDDVTINVAEQENNTSSAMNGIPQHEIISDTADCSINDAPTVSQSQVTEKSSILEIVNVSNDDATEKSSIPEIVNVSNDDASEPQIALSEKPSSTTNEVAHSSVIDHDDNCDEPKSVESTELQIIDLVEPEVVDLDDNGEPMELDSAPAANGQNLKVVVEQLKCNENDSRTSPVNEKIQQFFDNTAKEIITAPQESRDILNVASDSAAVANNEHKNDIFMSEMCTTETEIPLSVLNSFLDTDKRKRKRDDPVNNDQVLNHISEKRSRIDELKSKDLDKENRSVTNSADTRKKASNIARKHTSSTNSSKTVKEIEKTIRDDFAAKKKEERKKAPSREPSPLNDFDQYDIILNESVAENVEIRCNDVPQNVDNSHSIRLNTDVISKENLKNIFKIMRKKLTRRQLEEIVIQKCCEMISDSNEIGELRRQVTELQQAEFYRKQKVINLEKQIYQLKAVCQRYQDQVKETRGDKQDINPIKITRSVGLQVAIDSTPHIQQEPSPASRHEDRLKKLLTAPVPNKKSLEDRRETPSSRHVTTASPSCVNKNTDPKLINNYSEMNDRVSSPLCNNPAPPTSPSLASRNSILVKKTVKPASDPTVIDLTDKDDKNDNEANIAANNLLASVNGSVLTYVPVKVNQDQSRQTFKPGTQLIVNGQLVTVQSKPYSRNSVSTEHPAPVPQAPLAIIQHGTKPLPPKPTLRIAKNGNGIMLSWNMPDVSYAKVSKYQLYAYQETNVPPTIDLWKAVGDVDALPLPMACTLTQFVEGYRYHFIVRAVDVHGRIGPFSLAESIIL